MNLDLSKYTKRLGADMEKLGIGDKLRSAADKLSGLSMPDLSGKRQYSQSASSMAKVLVGAPGMVGEYYFPPELIGGTCPRIAGEEEDIVWNAAAEACDSERVHVVWQSQENKIWYLAVRSSELASHPNTWCPFASLLPGMQDANPSPVCYTYYGDDMATMMAITSEGLQIYRGTTLVVRAKAERTARELGDAPIVELIQDKIMQLTAVSWYSISLFEDRGRRILSALAVFGALALAGISFLVWLFASMSLVSANRDIEDSLARTQTKSMELVKTSEKLRASPMRDQLAKFMDLNDGLLALNGFLEVYEIKGGRTRWRATVPSNVTADKINELGGKNLQTTAQGVAIGNSGQVEYEAQQAGTGKK